MNMRTLRCGMAAVCLAIVVAGMDAAGQGRGARPAGPPQTARQAAPIDLTGTWVSVVTEDWRWRMVTPPKGDVASVPVSAEGRKAAQALGSRGRQRGRQSVQGVRRRRHHAAAGTAAHLVAGRSDAEARVRRRHADATAQLRSREAAAGGEDVGRASRSRSGKVRASAAAPGCDGRPRVTGRRDPARVRVPGGGGQGLRGGPPPRQQARDQQRRRPEGS